MNFFLAKIIYRIICGKGEHTPQFDIQTRIICAQTSAEAFCKASDLGGAEAYCFYNEKQQLVQWQFINVTEIICLSEYAHGAEINSTIKEAYYPDEFMADIHRKAAAIMMHTNKNIEQPLYN